MCCEGVDDEFKLQALLHDASEAYAGDIPSPIKKRLPDYKAMEDNLMRCIAAKFGFGYPLCNEVKAIDRIMLQHEWDYLMLDKICAFPMECWTPEHAKSVFLRKFNYITLLSTTRQV